MTQWNIYCTLCGLPCSDNSDNKKIGWLNNLRVIRKNSQEDIYVSNLCNYNMKGGITMNGTKTPYCFTENPSDHGYYGDCYLVHDSCYQVNPESLDFNNKLTDIQIYQKDVFDWKGLSQFDMNWIINDPLKDSKSKNRVLGSKNFIICRGTLIIKLIAIGKNNTIGDLKTYVNNINEFIDKIYFNKNIKLNINLDSSEFDKITLNANWNDITLGYIVVK